MRWKKSGLETKLREKQPNLLGIDETYATKCTVKKFFSPFENFVEKVVDDLQTASKSSPDVHKASEEMCMILDIPLKIFPKISHCWLSAYDCTVPLVTQLDAYYLFCFACLEKDLHSLDNEDVKVICDGHKTNDTGKKRVSEIQKYFCQEVSNDGKDHKTCIVEKLIIHNTKVFLIFNF